MKLKSSIIFIFFTSLFIIIACASPDTKPAEPPLAEDSLIEIKLPGLLDTAASQKKTDSFFIRPVVGTNEFDSALLLKQRLVSDSARALPEKVRAEMKAAIEYMKRKQGK